MLSDLGLGLDDIGHTAQHTRPMTRGDKNKLSNQYPHCTVINASLDSTAATVLRERKDKVQTGKRQRLKFEMNR